MSGVQNVLDRAKKGATNTNFLDSSKRRIYATSRGAMFTKIPGGYRNYKPNAKYMNKPGTNLTKKLY
jgi:hypothetical protein